MKASGWKEEMEIEGRRMTEGERESMMNNEVGGKYGGS